MKSAKTTIYMPLVLAMILFISNSRAQIWTDTILGWDNDYSKTKVEYYGDWIHMNNGGSYPNDDESTAVYRFWGFGIDIYTERMHHHSAYIVNIDGIDLDTVNVKDDRDQINIRTYFNHKLKYGNHILTLRRLNGYFVLNQLVKYVDSDPNMHPYWADTIIKKPVYVADTIHGPDFELPGDTIKDPDIVLPPDTIKAPPFVIPGDTLKCPELGDVEGMIRDQSQQMKKINIILIAFGASLLVLILIIIVKQ